MYKRTSAFGKHIDFYILDLILFAISYIIGYVIRFGFRTVDYLGTAPVSFGIILLVIYLLVAIFTRAYHNILYRNKWFEMISTLLQVVITLVIFLLYLYVTKQSEILPRLMFGYVAIAAFLLIWFCRCVYKNIVRKRYNNNPNRPHLLIISETTHIDAVLDSLRKQKFNDFYLSGLAIKGCGQ